MSWLAMWLPQIEIGWLQCELVGDVVATDRDRLVTV